WYRPKRRRPHRDRIAGSRQQSGEPGAGYGFPVAHPGVGGADGPGLVQQGRRNRSGAGRGRREPIGVGHVASGVTNIIQDPMSDDANPQSPVSPSAVPEEREFEAALRPKTLEELVGQERVREQLALVIE